MVRSSWLVPRTRYTKLSMVYNRQAQQEGEQRTCHIRRHIGTWCKDFEGRECQVAWDNENIVGSQLVHISRLAGKEKKSTGANQKMTEHLTKAEQFHNEFNLKALKIKKLLIEHKEALKAWENESSWKIIWYAFTFKTPPHKKKSQKILRECEILQIELNAMLIEFKIVESSKRNPFNQEERR